MKKIGIVGNILTGGMSYGITLPYMSFFSMFGEVILLSPWDKEIRDLDLLVLPGGADVLPTRYLENKQKIHIMTQAPNMIYEKFDREMLPQYIEKGTPIFGICRGHQSLAVYFGAKIKQHMYHETNPEKDRMKLVHKLRFHEEGIMALGGTPIEPFEVNSMHHQVVLNCPFNASVLATYDSEKLKEDELGSIEALTYWPQYPAHTVQWHPKLWGLY